MSDFKKLIEDTLKDLYNNENKLFEINIHERSIVFHFGRYLIERLKTTGFSKYNVDVEYNRYQFLKKVRQNNISIFPDLIIHKRGKKDNVLIMEFKCLNNNDVQNDYKN